MLSSVQSKLQGVAAAGAATTVLAAAAAPPKPFSFLKLKSVGVGGARRALAALGPNNAKFNMSMAKSQLAMDQEVFSKRWNFNPAKEVPLAPGRYQWAPLTAAENGRKTTPSQSEIVAKDLSKPLTEDVYDSATTKAAVVRESTQEDDGGKCKVHLHCENQVGPVNKSKPPVQSLNTDSIAVPMKNVTSSSQNCITDFYRSQKRKSGYINDACIPCPNTPPKKKARAIH